MFSTNIIKKDLYLQAFSYSYGDNLINSLIEVDMINDLYHQHMWTHLYKQLLRQIASHEAFIPYESKWIEQAFCITVKTWFNIQQTIDDYRFKDQQEEINFYKMVKPRFVGLIDYFAFLYKSVLFQPDDTLLKNEYWLHELAVCEKFLSRHDSFCRYYEQGSTGLDVKYFAHKQNQQPLLFGVNETKRHVISSYSHLLARVIAIRKYKKYISAEIVFLRKYSRTKHAQERVIQCLL